MCTQGNVLTQQGGHIGMNNINMSLFRAMRKQGLSKTVT